MKRYYTEVYDTEIGNTQKLVPDNIVLEGRVEILQVLRALRASGNRVMAKKLWSLHSGFRKCPRCSSISSHFVRAGFYSYHMGWDIPICATCYDACEAEYKAHKMRGSMK